MPKICDLAGVREYAEGYPVELWRDDTNGRLVLLALNEAGFNSVRIDLWDLLSCLQRGLGDNGQMRIDDSIFGAASIRLPSHKGSGGSGDGSDNTGD